MSLISTRVSESEKLRWQVGAHKVLGAILDICRDRGLPVIPWEVSEFAVVGKVQNTSHEQRRGVFEAWVEALGLDRWPESPHSAGWVHLHAFTENWERRRVNVAVLADIDTEE
ncbi:hypothetical protein ACGFNU_20915 [Spirillospora sp. NPDC048911]|uniref:hypothetical protein n=1 Tax=Spirillospora sp. NPDC048911 TaxID=3364527 RepID=UPI0037142C6D